MEVIGSLIKLLRMKDIVSTSKEILEKFIRELHRLTTYVKILPDGLAIRAGIVLIFAVAFPQVIEEGKLYMVEPPLFGFKENGKMVFKSTNREYLTYLQDKFAKKNTLYFGNHKFKNSELTEFLVKNERYMEFLKNVADSNVCSPLFIELIMSNISDIGIEKESIPKWNKLLAKKFSKQITGEWSDGRIILSGIKDGRYEMIELDEALLKSKKTNRLLSLMNQNLLNIHGYSIEGEIEKEDISLYEVLKIFNKYKADGLKRFKGSNRSPSTVMWMCTVSNCWEVVKLSCLYGTKVETS